MKLKNYIILLLVTCTACNQKPVPTTDTGNAKDTNKTASEDYSAFKYVEAFKGTLRCADCPGIVTEITFVNDNLSYHETDSYLERNVTNKLTGSYTTDRGYKKDDDATVYVLDDDKRGHERRFLKLDDNTILMLDGNGEITDTTEFFKLYRIK